jgi:hypothetical protein
VGGEALAEVGLEAAAAPDAIHEDGLEDDGSGKKHGRNHSVMWAGGQWKNRGRVFGLARRARRNTEGWLAIIPAIVELAIVLGAMRNNVSFRNPVTFISVSEEESSILSVAGAGWFVSLLKRISGLTIRDELCQEDWGVVVFAERDGKKFWIGLSPWPEGDAARLAHLHQQSGGWLKRLTGSSEHELENLAADLHQVLSTESAISDIGWYCEKDMAKAYPQRYSTPSDA